MNVFVAALLSRLPEGMFVACSPGCSRCPLPQYHKRLPPIGHAAPRPHAKAEALPGWKWIGATFGVKKQPLWKKAVQFAAARFRKLLVAMVVVMFSRLLTLWYARWFSPRCALARAAWSAGKCLRSGEVVTSRPREEAFVTEFINLPGPFLRQVPSFQVVSGSQGVGKSTMLSRLLFGYWKDSLWKRGRWVLPIQADLTPNEKLELSSMLIQALSIQKLPDNYPSTDQKLLEQLNEWSKAWTGEPVIIYLQLTTKNRADEFSYNECDTIASTVGAFARRLTYDNALCKFIVEVSVSLIADKIKQKFNMSRLLVVQPLPFAKFFKVMKTDKMLSGRLEQVLGKDAGQTEDVLKYYYLRAGGNFRDLAELLENVAEAGSKGAAAVKTQIEEWYQDKIKPLRDCLALQTSNKQSRFQGFLESVAKAGPLGYICENATERSLKWELRLEKPAAGIIRSTTSTSITLKHWHFAFKILGESEQKMKDYGYM